MPARQVPKNYCSLSGEFLPPKRDLGVFRDDSLQSELIILLKFDQRVVSFEEQPVQIPFIGADGRMQIYTPDFLVSYHYLEKSDPITTCLVETKERALMKSRWAQYRHAYKAAIAFASSRGWKFKILSEIEIQNIYLEPSRFINLYSEMCKFEKDPWLESFALESLAIHARSLLKVPVYLILHDDNVQMQLAHKGRSGYQLFGQLFRLVLSGKIAIDAKQFNARDPFRTELWISEPSNKPLFISLKLPGLWRK